jgi:catechol 2,3-dioxygenase-like lactoylglutathione lyase family enzyme
MFMVEHMDRALAFYRDVLGMKVDYSSEYFSMVECDRSFIGLHWSEGRPMPEQQDYGHDNRSGTVSLEVDDIDTEVARLRGLKVQFLGEISRNPWWDDVAFADPDGNLLRLVRPKA